MILIRSRLGFVVASLAVAFICWAVVYLPPYEKIVYENSPVLSQEEADEMTIDAFGYKGEDAIKRVYCVDDIIKRENSKRKSVVLEIDTSNLKKLGIYQCVSERYKMGNIEKNKIKVFFKRTVKSYGQYYIATLESGEKIPVFIDDNLVPIKKNTTVQLPIGNWNMTTVDFSKYDVDDFFDNCFLDCVSGFATGPEMQDFRFMEKMAVLVIIVVMVVFLGIVLGINIGKARK